MNNKVDKLDMKEQDKGGGLIGDRYETTKTRTFDYYNK